MADPSFDIVSKIDKTELANAVAQAMTEISTRFDFKGSNSEIKVDDENLTILSDDAIKIKQVIDVLMGKMAKRGIGLKSFNFDSKIEPATGQTVRMKVKIQTSMDKDQVKQVIKLIKDSGLKVAVTGMGDSVRVSGKKKDDLQDVQGLLRKSDLPFDCQFTNYK